jgi:rRNA-processing protein FCF1
MEFNVLPDVSGDVLLGLLRDARNWLGNVGRGTLYEGVMAYTQWASIFSASLRTYLEPDEVNRLITTQRYWTLTTLIPFIDKEKEGAISPTNVLANTSLRQEIQERSSHLGRVIVWLEKEVARWRESRGTLVVADTNVYLHHDKIFTDIKWPEILGADGHNVHLVIPSVVIDELDRAKIAGSGKVGSLENLNQEKDTVQKSENLDTVKKRAKITLREIEILFPTLAHAASVKPGESELGNVFVSLLLESVGHIRHPRPDSEILNRAIALQSFTTREVIVVTYDTGMALRVRMANMNAINLSKAIKE